MSLTLHQFPSRSSPPSPEGAGFSIALAAHIRLAGGTGDLRHCPRCRLRRLRRELVPHATRRPGEVPGAVLHVAPAVVDRGALGLGIVNQVVPDDGFDKAALDWSRSLAEWAPIPLRHMKENLNRATTSDLATALDAEAAAMVRTMSTADHREAAAAVAEKRTRVFRGE